MAIRPADHGVVAAQGGGVPLLYSQSGGTVSVSGVYTYVKWLASGSLTITGNNRNVEWFQLSGGASGGKANLNGSGAGGGGAGGYWAHTVTNMASEVHTVTVGAGAAGATVPPTGIMSSGNNGSPTTVNPAGSPIFEVYGGGFGAGFSYSVPSYYDGHVGGCGGGGGGGSWNGSGGLATGPQGPGAVTGVTGNRGGDGTRAYVTGQIGGGGGGGVGSAGVTATWGSGASTFAGNGGSGATHALLTGVGLSTVGGGGGGCGSATSHGPTSFGSGGSGGGTPGVNGASNAAPANSGSGTGGAHENSGSGAGGSGLVICRWVTLI
jgi:hypothetical protein